MRRRRTYPRLRRRWAANRVCRVACRCGRLDARWELGPLSLSGLQRARKLAVDEGVEVDELDEVTLDAVEAGRASP